MITNRSPARVRRPIETVLAKVYEPKEGDWSYSHHASICYFQGFYHAMWSNGRQHEDDIGQRVLHCVSVDGVTWSIPDVLFESFEGNSVLTAAGFLVHKKMIAAYAGLYVYDSSNVRDGCVVALGKEHTHTTLFRIESDNGFDWSSPEDLGIPIVPNHGPEITHSGRLIISGNIMFPYTDDPTGKKGWTLTGTPPFPWEPLFDDSDGFVRKAENYGKEWLCEGSFYQTDDEVLHMLQRSSRKVLFVTRSHDDGETWTESTATQFTDCGAKFHCGRLPDGRFYIVSNPDPAAARCPLIINISKDGIVFDREYIIDDRYVPRRIEGNAKGGIYGYPHSLIHDNHMFVICSVNKEDVYVYRFSLSQLQEE